MLKLTLKFTLIYMNVSFNSFLEQCICAFSSINKRRDIIKMHSKTVKKSVEVFIFVFEVSHNILNEGITMCLQFNYCYTVYVRTIFFILKQGCMFRLKVSHLQALTTFSVTRCFAHFGIP